MVAREELTVRTLGPCTVDSPLLKFLESRPITVNNVAEDDGVLFDDCLSVVNSRGCPTGELPIFEPAGPRKKIFFDPSKTRAGIVTCGGLCPGLNNVIRALVMELYFRYGVKRIYGFQNGFEGFTVKHAREVIDLTPEVVSNINEQGGTMLGTSRGAQDPNEIVDCLERMNIQILFVIGGDGSLKGALKISETLRQRQSRVAVVGIPKTIDNDIAVIDQSFGFQTAFSVATESIRAAHVEARASNNGVGMVKVMGRHSGFIACYAALAQNDANFVLVPEIPFQLQGEQGFLPVLAERIKKRGHALVLVAEGAGQELMRQAEQQFDASGNAKLEDIGIFLRQQIQQHFREQSMECNIKYIDPSYLIRSVPANPFDSVYCLRLAHNAVHAAMCGKTEMVIARYKGRFVHMPIPMCVRAPNRVDPYGDLWMSVLESTGQPVEFK